MTNISEWSVTAGLNTASPPDGWPEGMARSAVNDTAREMMAAIARFYRDQNGTLVSGGTSTAFTLTTNTVYTAHDQIGMLTFRAHDGIDGALTLTVDGLAAKDIVTKDHSDLMVGDIREDQMVSVVWNDDEDHFEMLNEVGDRPATVKAWAGENEPPGWLWCAGQEVLRADYPYLFQVIGETYGEGDASTTFELPDLRGRVVAGRDDMGGDDAERLDDTDFDPTVLGDAGGDQYLQDHDHSISQHSHSFSGTTSTDGSHNHDAGNSLSVDQPGGAAVRTTATGNVSTSTDGSHTHTYSGNTSTGGPTSTGSEGDGDSGNVQPTMILNYIIKT